MIGVPLTAPSVPGGYSARWRMRDAEADDWPRGNHSITIKGDPGMYLEFGPTWNDKPRSTTSMHAVNAIPYVCAADPGIQTFLDLPWIVGRGAGG